MIQINWTKRQEIKYRYQLKRAKQTAKLKTPVKEQPTMLSNLGGLLPILKNLDADQIGILADRFLGEPESGSDDVVGSLIDFASNNPEVVEGFLKGIGARGGSNEPPTETEGHKAQV